MGVLIERAHYYTIFVEGIRTIREGVLNKEGALTEEVRYSGNHNLTTGRNGPFQD